MHVHAVVLSTERWNSREDCGMQPNARYVGLYQRLSTSIWIIYRDLFSMHAHRCTVYAAFDCDATCCTFIYSTFCRLFCVVVLVRQGAPRVMPQSPSLSCYCVKIFCFCLLCVALANT